MIIDEKYKKAPPFLRACVIAGGSRRKSELLKILYILPTEERNIKKGGELNWFISE